MKPVILNLATNRKDKGKTDNYTIYEGGGTFPVQNRKGEPVQKNVILGGNGSVYVGHAIAGKETAIVVMGKSEFDKLMDLAAPQILAQGKEKKRAAPSRK